MADDPEVVSRLSQEMAQALGQSLVKIGNEMQKLDRISKNATSNSGGIGQLDSTLASVGTRLLGPVGVAAGLYQMSSALSKVAESSVVMQAFSRNTGMASENIKDIQLQLRMMGKSTAEANGAISSINGLLNDLATYKEESSLAKTMFGREGGAAFINRLNAAKDRMGQIDEILRTYRAGNDRQKRGLADALGLDVDTLDRLQTNSGLLRNAYNINAADMRKYHEQTVIFEHNVSEAWKAISGNVITALNQITGGIDGSASTFESAVKRINAATNAFFSDSDKVMDKVRATIEEIRTLSNIYSDLQAGEYREAGKKAYTFFGLPGSEYGPPAPKSVETADPMGEHDKGSTFPGRFHGWMNQRSGIFSPETLKSWNDRGVTDFGGMRRYQSIEEDQSKTLIDIRDILQRMEGGPGGLGGGGGSGSADDPGGGRRALGNRLGIDQGSSADAARGPNTSVGSRGNRNHNRGNLKFGQFAQSMGATGQDEKGFAIFPDTATGDAAQEALLKSDRYKGLTLDQFGDKYAEGSRHWKDTVGKALGIGRNDVVDNQNPTLADAIRRAEGTGGTGTGDGRVNYFQRRGQGPFSASELERVQTPYGPITVHPEAAGDFRNFFRELGENGAPLGKLGSYNYRRMRWSNQWSSHSTGAAVDLDDAQFLSPKMQAWISSDPARWEDIKRRYNLTQPLPRKDPGHVEWTGPSAETEAARRRMDATRNSIWSKGTVGVDVNFKNVPPGVSTSATSNGDIFEKLKVSTSRQNQVAGGSTGEPFAGVW
jgi:hypothetical protein